MREAKNQPKWQGEFERPIVYQWTATDWWCIKTPECGFESAEQLAQYQKTIQDRFTIINDLQWSYLDIDISLKVGFSIPYHAGYTGW